MPAVLNAPENINEVADKYKITSFAVDLERQEIHVVYEKQNAAGNAVASKMETLSGAEFPEAITETAAEAGVDVYFFVKTVLYRKILAKANQTAVIT